MNTYGIEHDYVETAIGFDEQPRNAQMPNHGIMMRSDHIHEPTFAVYDLTDWRAVSDEDFTGIVKRGQCSKCNKHVLLRVPRHLVVALRLLGKVC